MASDDPQKAQDLCDRVWQNLSVHFKQCEEHKAIEKRGEKEVLCIMFAVRAKAKVLRALGNPEHGQEEDWQDAISDCKAFLFRYEQITSSGNPVKLHSQEKKILGQSSRSK